MTVPLFSLFIFKVPFAAAAVVIPVAPFAAIAFDLTLPIAVVKVPFSSTALPFVGVKAPLAATALPFAAAAVKAVAVVVLPFATADFAAFAFFDASIVANS